jgi:hypothetical protein
MPRREPFLIEYRWPEERAMKLQWVKQKDGSETAGPFKIGPANYYHHPIYQFSVYLDGSRLGPRYKTRAPARRYAQRLADQIIAAVNADAEIARLQAENEALMAVARAAYMACTEDISEPDTQELWECLRALPPELRARLEV